MKKFLLYTMVVMFLFSFFTSCDEPIPDNTDDVSETVTLIPDSTVTTAGESDKGSITTADDSHDTSDKELVVDIFMKKGEYSDGVYSFRKYSSSGNCDFVYSFSYKPSIDMFNCGVLITTFAQNVTMYDYGSITFTWEEFNNASYYGYHELKNVASIHFDFYPSKANADMTFNNFNYSVRSNSFSDLTDTSDIEKYAESCFECAQQGWLYAQSVLYGYGYN